MGDTFADMNLMKGPAVLVDNSMIDKARKSPQFINICTEMFKITGRMA